MTFVPTACLLTRSMLKFIEMFVGITSTCVPSLSKIVHHHLSLSQSIFSVVRTHHMSLRPHRANSGGENEASETGYNKSSRGAHEEQTERATINTIDFQLDEEKVLCELGSASAKRASVKTSPKKVLSDDGYIGRTRCISNRSIQEGRPPKKDEGYLKASSSIYVSISSWCPILWQTTTSEIYQRAKTESANAFYSGGNGSAYQMDYDAKLGMHSSSSVNSTILLLLQPTSSEEICIRRNRHCSAKVRGRQ